MNKAKGWAVGLTIVALLGVGVVVFAGNGFGQGAGQATRQSACSETCVAAQDGTGNGAAAGYGQHRSASRPLDGTGYHGGRAAGQTSCGAQRGSCAGARS